MKVTFLGLGIMGSRMARHILNSDHQLTVWNRSPAPVDKLVAAGAAAGKDVPQAVRDADLVISMLATPEVVRKVMLDDGGLTAMKQGAVWADSSTVGPAFARECAAAATAAGVRYLGTPVAGTREPAARGELKILVGGDAKVLEECRSVFQTFGSDILHVGMKPEQGAELKILINGMLAQSMLVFSETVRLGEGMGMDSDFLLDTLSGMAVIAPFVGSKLEHMRSGEYGDVSFPLELMHKDLNLVVEAAYQSDSPAPLAALSREIFGRAKREGRGRDDFSAIHGTPTLR